MARERFWELPALAIAAAIVAAIVMPILDEQITLPDAVAMSGDEDTARAVLGGIVTLAVSVAGVSFSVIAVALVLASQQLSPRVLRSFQRQPLNQAVLAVLLGTATYSLFVLGSVSDARDQPVPELSVTVAMVLAAGALGLFVLFLHHAVRSLNASTVIRRIAAEGQESVALPYPAGAGSQPADGEPAEREADAWQDRVGCVEVRAPRAGYVVSVDGSKIVDWASANDAFVEQRRGVGAFAVTGGVVAVIRCDDAHAVDARGVNDAFMLREERLVDGDVALPVRQLADIALKGLSAGINDPTTAENAMDSVTDRWCGSPAATSSARCASTTTACRGCARSFRRSTRWCCWASIRYAAMRPIGRRSRSGCSNCSRICAKLPVPRTDAARSTVRRS